MTDLWSVVEKTPGCWLWRGPLTSGGYGCIRDGKTFRYAHRVAWEQVNGPISGRLQVRHLCGDKTCVRPDHMLVGRTWRANSKRRIKNSPERRSTYVSWRGMHSRCSDPSSPDWPNYGARGIRVCAQWASFETFLADMGLRPSADHSIDRIDNDGHYELSNVRWATRVEQNRNRRSNFRISHGGETLTLIEWSERTGIHASTIRRRLTKMGWSPARALTEPPREWGPGRPKNGGAPCL